MSIVFRAADAPLASRLDYWSAVLAETVTPMQVRCENGPDIRDEIVTGTFGPVRVTEVATGPGEARRTTQHIRRSDPETYQLFVQVGGTAVGEQNGHSVELTPGDLSLTDLSRPFRCRHSTRRAVLVAFPRAELPLARSEVTPLVGTRIRGDQDHAALIATVARQLPRQLERGVGPARLGTALLDLLTVELERRLEHRVSLPEPQQRALRQRIKAFIEARLADPALTPAAVAAAHYISLRYLHKLFEAEDQGVAGLIRQRRLQRCRADLLQPALAHRPVSATAKMWGFPDAAHFNRLFRATYGLPPAQYRASATAPTPRLVSPANSSTQEDEAS